MILLSIILHWTGFDFGKAAFFFITIACAHDRHTSLQILSPPVSAGADSSAKTTTSLQSDSLTVKGRS